MQFTFESSTHIYRADGRPVPSVTQILSAVGISPDLRFVDRAVLERKRQIGIALHACLQFLQEGDLDESTIDPEVRTRLDGYLLFVKDHGFKPTACELRRWPVVNGMRYGMQADVTGTIAGIPVLVDFKTTEGSPHPAWGCQTAGYSLGLPAQMIPPFHYRRYSLQLLENGRYKIHEWKDNMDFQVFKWALALTYWKMNNGSKPWEENQLAA